MASWAAHTGLFTIAKYIDEGTAFLVAEDAVNLPGVELHARPDPRLSERQRSRRTSIGYMGHIPEESLAQVRGARATPRTSRSA